jgi:poly(A) polymerase
MTKHKVIVDKVFNIFKDNNIYLVGGSVRNFLINQYKNTNIEIDDLDFAIDCKPEETIEILKKNNLKYYPIGIKFGTIGFALDDMYIEVTTFRKNEKYNHHNRFPSVEFGLSIEEDLARRDFTINAIALDRQWTRIDPYKGSQDIIFEKIRCPLSADIAFSDDPLRMLRAIRFASKLNFNIMPETYLGIEKNVHLILNLSVERIQDEFNKILLSNNPRLGLDLLAKTRLLNYFLHELVPCINLDQGLKWHHKDVWGHVLDVVNNLRGCNNLELLLAGVLHDIAKPYTRSITKIESSNVFILTKDEIHFYNHDWLGGIIAEGILKRLKYSNDTIKKVCFLVSNHMRPNHYNTQWKDSAVRRFVQDVGEYREDVLELSKADITSHNPDRVLSGVARIDELAKRCKELKELIVVKYPLDGNDIMLAFNLTQGKDVGIMKKRLEEAYNSGILNINSTKEDCLELLKKEVLWTAM